MCSDISADLNTVAIQEQYNSPSWGWRNSNQAHCAQAINSSVKWLHFQYRSCVRRYASGLHYIPSGYDRLSNISISGSSLSEMFSGHANTPRSMTLSISMRCSLVICACHFRANSIRKNDKTTLAIIVASSTIPRNVSGKTAFRLKDHLQLVSSLDATVRVKSKHKLLASAGIRLHSLGSRSCSLPGLLKLSWLITRPTVHVVICA